MSQATIYLKDYQPTPYQIQQTDLTFELVDGATKVTNRMQINRRAGVAHDAPLCLDGEELTLLAVRLNAQSVTNYVVQDDKLTLVDLPEQFTLEIETQIHPEANTSLSGLYQSSGNYCTQCEAEGFRRITYYYDRPDVMAKFSCKMIADAQRYPVLLSNGNLIEKGQLADGRHWVLWQDPFPKPAYLFALVAGNLAHIHDTFTTVSGRKVDLYIYTEPHNIDQCQHAMDSLKRSMRWDEEVYGREYDLDIYMIVAVDDFNMGAMENKGLNVFNTKYVLAKQETATDVDYQGIEGVIAHEYFHNWSGNRVTCRDWFQLSLKEGFTVFRDQEFSADMQSRGVNRIEDVNLLRTHQFREDASPMAHPVRPESYVEINNFYTVTIYEKGGEVIRMLRLLLGKENFRKGTDLYFDRHDGQAVTTDDFVKAMEDANGVNLSQFKLWYSQAGTPELTVRSEFKAETSQFILHVSQHIPDTPNQTNKQPMLIPLAVGLLDDQGQDLIGTQVLQVTQATQSFTFDQIHAHPTPSLLRGFSAPVKLSHDLNDEQLYFLMAHDSDDFVRWDAGQQIAIKLILQLCQDLQAGKPLALDHRLTDAFRTILQRQASDLAMTALALTLPSEAYLSGFMNPIEPVVLHQARNFVKQQIAQQLREPLLATYQALDAQSNGEFKIDKLSMARRKLKNVCLAYLMEKQDDQDAIRLCQKQFTHADNMTDKFSALTAMVNCNAHLAQASLESFYNEWHTESLVVDKWLTLQATSQLEGTLAHVKTLTEHPAFKLTNPNKVRSLIGAFCSGNPAQFHDKRGAGYQFLSEQISKLNQINPQIAARLVTPLISWRKYNAHQQALMRTELEKIAALPDLSKDVYEVVSKALG